MEIMFYKKPMAGREQVSSSLTQTDHAGQQLEASDNAHVHQVITSPHTIDPEMIDAESNNTFAARGYGKPLVTKLIRTY